MQISFALMTHNETTMLQALLDNLVNYLNPEREIVILDDFSEEPTRVILDKFAQNPQIKVFQRRLNKNFAAQRNFLKQQCTGSFIWLFDPDETPVQWALDRLDAILNMMEGEAIDACAFPRINIWKNVDAAHTRMQINAQGWVGYPDYQNRIIRNHPKFYWIFRVHEYLIGPKRVYYFPAEEAYSLREEKDFTHFAHNQSFYKAIPFAFFRKTGKSIVHRLGLVKYEKVACKLPWVE